MLSDYWMNLFIIVRVCSFFFVVGVHYLKTKMSLCWIHFSLRMHVVWLIWSGLKEWLFCSFGLVRVHTLTCYTQTNRCIMRSYGLTGNSFIGQCCLCLFMYRLPWTPIVSYKCRLYIACTNLENIFLSVVDQLVDLIKIQFNFPPAISSGIVCATVSMTKSLSIFLRI